MLLSVFLKLSEILTRTEDKILCRFCPLTWLSVTVRWIAGGSYLDMAMAHQVSSSTAFYYAHGTIDRLDREFTIEFPYRDHSWLTEVAHKFKLGAQSVVSICCGAIDSISVKIVEPTKSEVPNTSTNYNRKGFFSPFTLCMCDSRYQRNLYPTFRPAPLMTDSVRNERAVPPSEPDGGWSSPWTLDCCGCCLFLRR